MVVLYPSFQLDSDTMNMRKYASHNESFAYVLVLMDILSRKAWTRSLKMLQGQESAEIFERAAATYSRTVTVGLGLRIRVQIRETHATGSRYQTYFHQK